MKEDIVHIPELSALSVRYYIREESTVYPEHAFPFHLHDQIELYVLLEGDVSFAVESTVYRMRPGDVIVTAPNERHNCILNTTSVHRHACFWLDPGATFLLGDFLSHPFGEQNLISVNDKAREALLSTVRAMSRRASEDVQGFYADLVQMLFLLRGGLRTSAPVTELPAVLVSILAQMDASFATDVRMEELAEQHYLSPSTMYRLFRQYLHTTPHLYLESKRLSHARRLLKGGARVLSAALESGFSDSSSFIRLFKKRFSISPREYRDGVRTPQSPTTGGR